MCYASAHLPSRVSTTRVARLIATVAFAVMFLLVNAITGCMTIRDCTINVTNKDGRQTVSIGDKDVRVPIDANVPASALGVQ